MLRVLAVIGGTNMLTRRNFVLGTSASAVALSAVHAADGSRLDGVRAIAQQMMSANPLPSLSIAVMQDAKLVFAEAFGKVDLELGTRATAAHRYRLGSVAKVITATLAARLAAPGAVHLDAGIGG